MTCEQCREWLGDALENTLDSERRAQLDSHCGECESCRGMLGDLREIRAAAAMLERRVPSPELWSAIAAKVQPAPVWPRLTKFAAAAALVLSLSAAAWFGMGDQWRGSTDGSSSDLVRNATTELQLAEQHYSNAITALEQLTVEKDTALDPSVAAEIAQSLQSIDGAIRDSRAALKSDPNSFVAQTSLLEALRMKVAVLQETVSLMNPTS